jgi:hypothetical protein
MGRTTGWVVGLSVAGLITCEDAAASLDAAASFTIIAVFLARLSDGNKTDISSAMTPTTTKSSINVNARSDLRIKAAFPRVNCFRH